jgi:type VI secretion system protein ImpF
VAGFSDQARVAPPLMHIFRVAHQAKDSAEKDPHGPAKDAPRGGRGPRTRQPITEALLRTEVTHDLEAMLNTVALEASLDMSDVPYVRRSILNFGIPDLANRTIDEARLTEIPEELRNAIINYEPRIVADTLSVERDTSVDASDLKVRFVVRAELMCEPVHLPVEFVADVVDTGKIVLHRR